MDRGAYLERRRLSGHRLLPAQRQAPRALRVPGERPYLPAPLSDRRRRAVGLSGRIQLRPVLAVPAGVPHPVQARVRCHPGVQSARYDLHRRRLLQVCLRQEVHLRPSRPVAGIVRGQVPEERTASPHPAQAGAADVPDRRCRDLDQRQLPQDRRDARLGPVGAYLHRPQRSRPQPLPPGSSGRSHGGRAASTWSRIWA